VDPLRDPSRPPLNLFLSLCSGSYFDSHIRNKKHDQSSTSIDPLWTPLDPLWDPSRPPLDLLCPCVRLVISTHILETRNMIIMRLIPKESPSIESWPIGDGPPGLNL
jgi:hypothetical protein